MEKRKEDGLQLVLILGGMILALIMLGVQK